MERDLLSGIRFAAKAEVARQAGNLDEARQIARDGLQDEPASVAGRIVLASVLFDLGATDEAQVHLESVLASLPGFEAELVLQCSPGAHDAPYEKMRERALDALHDDEVATAFSVAETDVEAVIDADQVAQDAMRLAHLDRPELGDSVEDEAIDAREAEDGELSVPFATGTVAKLLEQQGHLDAAQEIRAVIFQKNQTHAKTQDEDASSRDKIVATLEKWLQNLRGGVQ